MRISFLDDTDVNPVLLQQLGESLFILLIIQKICIAQCRSCRHPYTCLRFSTLRIGLTQCQNLTRFQLALAKPVELFQLGNRNAGFPGNFMNRVAFPDLVAVRNCRDLLVRRTGYGSGGDNKHITLANG